MRAQEPCAAAQPATKPAAALAAAQPAAALAAAQPAAAQPIAPATIPTAAITPSALAASTLSTASQPSATFAASTIATKPAAALAAALAALAMRGRVHGARDSGQRPGSMRRDVGREPMLSARSRRHRYVGQCALPPLRRKRSVPERPHCLVGRVRIVQTFGLHRHNTGLLETQGVLLEQSRECQVELIGLVRRNV